MQAIIYALVAFILLSSAFKLSMWKLWQTILYSAILSIFIFSSESFSILQSKTQILDLLENTTALQNMAIIVTLDSVFGFCFGFVYFERGDKGKYNKLFDRILYFFPPLLMFPIGFYILTQTIFFFVGVPFRQLTIIVSLSVFIVIPLFAQFLKFLLPSRDARVEMFLCLTCFVTILGLISTTTSKIIYAQKTAPIDIPMIIISIAIFIVMILLGIIFNQIKWKYFSRKKIN